MEAGQAPPNQACSSLHGAPGSPPLAEHHLAGHQAQLAQHHLDDWHLQGRGTAAGVGGWGGCSAVVLSAAWLAAGHRGRITRPPRQRGMCPCPPLRPSHKPARLFLHAFVALPPRSAAHLEGQARGQHEHQHKLKVLVDGPQALNLAGEGGRAGHTRWCQQARGDLPYGRRRWSTSQHSRQATLDVAGATKA